MKHAGVSSPSKGELVTHCTHWARLLMPHVPDGAPLKEWNSEFNKLPSTETKYSREGVKAHKLLELQIGRALGDAQQDEIEKLTVTLTKRSLENVDIALKTFHDIYCKRAPCTVITEQKVHWSDDIWGSADITIQNRYGVLDVLDFKNGSGVGVSAMDSVQGACYAGSYLERPWQEINFWIIQPSHPDARLAVQRWRAQPWQLFDRMRDFELALEAVPSPPNVGTHCNRYFCPARKLCAAYKEANKEAPPKIDPKTAIQNFLNATRGTMNGQRNHD